MTVTVHGTYLTADDGTPATGRVSFTPHIIAVHDQSDPAHVVTQYAVTAPLDETGTFSCELIASDDPGWRTDADMPYLVCVMVDGYQTEFSVLIYGPGPVDLNDLLPLAESPGVGVVPIPGPQGPQGEVHVGSTVTLPAGSPATVVDTDPDPGVAVLDFGIPQGLKGDTGAQGVKGDKGDKGDQGIPGVQGPPGDLTKPVADARYHRNLLTKADWWVDAANVSADGLSLVDLSGRNRPAVFGLTTQKPIALPYTGTPYWYEPDPKAAAGSVVALATAPVANTTVQVVINGTLTHRTDQSAHAFFYGQESAHGWMVYSNPTGSVISRIYTSGTPGADVTLKTGGYSTKAWHRFTLTKATGVVTYEDSGDGTTWTQIGTGTNNVNPNPLSTSLNLGVKVAYSVPGTRYYVSATVDGAKVAEFDPKNWNTNYTQVTNTGTAGGNWTFNRTTTTTAPRGVIVDRPVILFGGGQKADVVGYRPNGDSVPLTVLVAVRDFSPTADTGYHLVATSNLSGDSYPGWAVYKSTTAVAVRAKDGAANSSAVMAAPVPIVAAYGGVISKASVTPYLAGVKGTPSVVALTTTAPDADLAIGRMAASYGNFEFLGAAVFERLLTDAEIAQASDELLGITPRTSRVTHPNTDDVLVESWDAGKGRWQRHHYHSSVRNVTITTAGILVRVNDTVTWTGTGTPPVGFRDSWATGAKTYLTIDALPTSLPGTLANPAPNL